MFCCCSNRCARQAQRHTQAEPAAPLPPSVFAEDCTMERTRRSLAIRGQAEITLRIIAIIPHRLTAIIAPFLSVAVTPISDAGEKSRHRSARDFSVFRIRGHGAVA